MNLIINILEQGSGPRHRYHDWTNSKLWCKIVKRLASQRWGKRYFTCQSGFVRRTALAHGWLQTTSFPEGYHHSNSKSRDFTHRIMKLLGTPNRAENPDNDRSKSPKYGRRQGEQSISQEIFTDPFIVPYFTIMFSPGSERIVRGNWNNLSSQSWQNKQRESSFWGCTDILQVDVFLDTAFFAVFLGETFCAGSPSSECAGQSCLSEAAFAPKFLADSVKLLLRDFMRGRWGSGC